MVDLVPIRRVRSTGEVDVLGDYDVGTRVLRLVRAGYPLLDPGDHAVEGDLPWVFSEMAPSGFMARRFARGFPELALPLDARLWSAAQVLEAVSRRGFDLPGNLVVGEESWERYERVFRTGPAPSLDRAAARDIYHHFVIEILMEATGSSVGGERPKFTLRLPDERGLLVKFTPPLGTSAGARWADLLRMEHHAAETLRAAGIAAVLTGYVEREDRGYLEVDRFDREAGGGRCGATTFYALGLTRGITEPPALAAALATDGVISSADAVLVDRVHRFSRALGNTDAHLGNYGLRFGDDGAVSIAPFFDITPMVLAPRHDELPDARVGTIREVPDGPTAALVQDLRRRAREDQGISRAFLDLWERHVAAAL